MRFKFNPIKSHHLMSLVQHNMKAIENKSVTSIAMPNSILISFNQQHAVVNMTINISSTAAESETL